MKNRSAAAGRPRLIYTAAALKAMGERAYQEDTYTITDRAGDGALLAMVADGRGGMQDGRMASRAAVKEVKEAFLHMDLRERLPDQLREAFVRASDRIYAQLQAEGGSTGIACVFYDGGLYYASVGDSCLLLRRGQNIYHLNRRQNMYFAVCMSRLREGLTDRAPAEQHAQRRALTDYLGKKQLIDIDRFLRPMPLYHGDTILVCSDGIGDVLSDEELRGCLSTPTPDESCRRIDELVLAAARRHQDNYTAVVIRVTEAGEG